MASERVKAIGTALGGTVALPPSKSYAHRYLFAAAFSEKGAKLLGDFSSRDARATVETLNALGARCVSEENGISVDPVRPRRSAVCDVGESGSTFRFSVPVAAALGTETEFILHGRLSERPMEALERCLGEHGVRCEKKQGCYVVSGKLETGKYRIDARESSQYATGLLLALPLLKGESEIEFLSEPSSRGYLDITQDVLERCGAQIERTERGYRIFGKGGYEPPQICKVEGDWSNAAFWMVAGLIGRGGMQIENLARESKQGDRKVSELLSRAGGMLYWEDDVLCVRPSELVGIDFDADDLPDAVPAMAVALGVARGKSRITGVERLKLKESDRLQGVIEIMNALGAKACYKGGVLEIEGVERYRFAELSGRNDHRMVMAGAIASVRAEGGVTLDDADAVGKSYPEFWREFCRMGGSVWEL